MGTTPKLAIPYPELTDAANVPVDLKELADRVEALLTVRNRTSGWLTAAAGWSVAASTIDVYARMAIYAFTVTRTGAAITVPVDGNIPTTLMCTFVPASWPLYSVGPRGSVEGRLASLDVNSTTGAMSMSAAAPGSNIATGEIFGFSGLFMLN